MPKISDGAIAQAAQSAGLSGGAVAIAVAIALAESGGDTTNHTFSLVTGDDSYGLWQINMLGQMGPDRRKEFNLSSNEDLYNPSINARVMASLSGGGTNWRAWTTYTRGTYLLFLSRGQAVASGLPQQGGISTTPVSVSDSLSSLTGFFNLIQNPQFWMRIGVFLVGAALVYFGIMRSVASSAAYGQIDKLGKTITGVVTKK